MTKALLDDRQLSNIADSIRSWGAVAILGAGASYSSGLPLSRDLSLLLKHILGNSTTAQEAFTEEVGHIDPSPKELIGTDGAVTEAAYRAVASERSTREEFKEAFRNIDRKRDYSITHKTIAELLHRRLIDTVVNLNWDTQLRSAWRAVYGRPLSTDDNLLYKPHGDADNLDTRWVFPHEQGRVPEELTQHLSDLDNSGPRVLLIVGYSEGDQEVVADIIAPLSERWKKSPIGPNATGQHALPAPSDDVFAALREQLLDQPELPGWEYVSFADQRDLRHAIRGVSLGPQDVESCPRLKAVSRLRRALQKTGHAVVSGRSGTGKSVSAYQAASDFCEEGWEIVRPTVPDVDYSNVNNLARQCEWPTIVLLDDADALSEQSIDRILQLAREDFRIVIVASDTNPPSAENVRISAAEAVRQIDQDFRTRRQELLPIIQAFDSRIGRGYLDIPLERRLTRAADQDSPWKYTFVLRGGWGNTKDEIRILRDQDRRDILLALVALGQLTSMDQGVSESWLRDRIEIFRGDPDWFHSGLSELVERRQISRSEPYRTPHRKFAGYILKEVYGRRNVDPNWQELVEIARAVIRNPPNLRGVSWLLMSRFREAGHYWSKRGAEIVDDATRDHLIDECFSADDQNHVRAASYVLTALLRWRPEITSVLSKRAGHIAQWIQDTNDGAAIGLATLLNDTYNKSEELCEEIVSRVDPEELANRFNSIVDGSSAGLGQLLSRLRLVASEDWAEKFRQQLDAEKLIGIAENETSTTLYLLQRLINGITAIDHQLGLDMARAAAPAFAESLNEDLVQGFRNIRDIRYYTFGLTPGFLRHEEPSETQIETARTVVSQLDSTHIQQAIERSRRRDWRTLHEFALFVFEATTEEHTAELLSFDSLDHLEDEADNCWESMATELESLLVLVETGWTGGNASDFLRRHYQEVGRITPLVMEIAPDFTADVIRDRHDEITIDLEVSSGLGWKRASRAIETLVAHNEPIATRVLRASSRDIAEGLSLDQANACEDLDEFLQLIYGILGMDTSLILSSIDENDIWEHWPARLQGDDCEKKAIHRLYHLAQETQTNIPDIRQTGGEERD